MSKAITKEEFSKRIEIRYPNEKFYIIEYTTASNPLKIQCLNCKTVLFYPQAKNFLAKNKIAGCSKCNGLRAKNERNITELKEKYEILDNTRNKNGQMQYTCKCKKCGRVSTHCLQSFINNKCRCESPGNHYTESEFKDILFQQRGNEYTLVSPFLGVNKKSLFKHACGFVWSTTPAHILYNKNGCPKCCKKQSKKCKIIETQLQKLNIPYEKEKFLENSLQRFDFYFEVGEQKYAIEYNGEQHYKYIPFFHGCDIENFKKYQERDQKKSIYCKNNNIKLIIIPYTFTNDEIKIFINKLFNSSTTNLTDVALSKAKQCSS